MEEPMNATINTTLRHRAFVVAALAAVLVLPTRTAVAADASDEARRAQAAGRVLKEITRANDMHIPASLLERARAIAVVPHVVRGAFIVGGRWGKGVVAARTTLGKWGPAAFIDLSGASVGFQIGGDATDLIMVFLEEGGLDALLNDRVELGANASVAAGPLGRSAEAGTNATLDAAIYAYSRSKGVFAGAALDGTVVTIDDDANAKAYGHAIDAKAVMKSAASAPAVFAPFLDAVRAVTPAAAR
jgi:lipid-binding SYLF domain-containing protein